jgi:hypothetical protein
MTQFRYRALDLVLEGTKKRISIVPEEYVHVRAYMLWNEEGRPEGKDFDNYMKAREEFLRENIIVPTEIYKNLEKIKSDTVLKSISDPRLIENYC